MSIRMTLEEFIKKETEIACFKVVYDGPSRPMIETPTGRLLSISEFNNGRWTSYDKEVSDCGMIVDVLNWFLSNRPDLINREML